MKFQHYIDGNFRKYRTGNVINIYDHIEARDIQTSMKISSERIHIWQVTMPKSGSKWLTNILRKIFEKEVGWKVIDMRQYPILGYNEFTHAVVAQYPEYNILSGAQHCCATPYILKCLEMFNIIPIFQVRNIFDIVVSFKEMIDMFFMNNKKAENQFAMLQVEYGKNLFPNQWTKLDNEARYDYVITFEIPDVLRLVRSWFEVADMLDNLIIVPYEKLNVDPYDTVSDLLTRLGLSGHIQKCEKVLNNMTQNRNHFNVGQIGRGRDLLSDQQIKAIQKYAKYYSSVDFTLIGL